MPAVFCSCAFCSAVRGMGMNEVRTRSQVLINGDLSIDFPPDANYHSFALGADLSAVGTLLVTHSHMDHFYAHDFILRGYKYARLSRPVLNIFANDEVGKVFGECTAREMKPQVAPHVRFTCISAYSVFEAGGYRIIAIPAEHSVSEQALLYYVEREGKGYLHLHDTGNVCRRAVDFLAQNGARADVVAYDCTFGAGSGGLAARHMGIPDIRVIRARLEEAGVADGKTVGVITHFSHNCAPFRKDMEELASADGLVAAYDGMTVSV